ncbi:MAG: TIGR03943 family protein [Anaerolineales bacterium]|nr:TIGR03943 family protein [Anaerolineales bacterium]MCB9128187.1 TIGR03943 family protein [Ardenticatenales bacterium]
MHEHEHEHSPDCDHHDHAPTASERWLPVVQALLIGGIGAMLLVKVMNGTLPLYVHVRYTPLIAATGVVLLLLAVAVLVGQWRADPQGHPDHDHDHGRLTWRSPALTALLVPILLGLMVPAQALGSAALSARGGVGTGGTGMRTVDSLADGASYSLPDPTSWTLLDWVNATLYEPDNPRVQGQAIEVEGFVWRDSTLPEGQIMLSRFVVSCCSADGLAIGMPVAADSTLDLANDQWLRVSGTVGLQERDGRKEAIILAESLTPIEQPAEPYLYP